MSPSATAPIVNWDALTPVLIILGAGVLGVLVEAFIARPARLAIQSTLSFLAILASGVSLFLRWGEVKAAGAAAAAIPQFQLPKGFLPGARMSAGLTEDPFSIAAQGILLVIGLLWVVTTYLFQGRYPLPYFAEHHAGDWLYNGNLYIGFLIMMSGFLGLLRWK